MRSLAAAAERLLRRCRWLALALLLLIHTVCFLNAAQHKRLWYDEIFTVTIARLPGWSAIMHALAAGVDLNPPLFYYLTHYSLALPGPIWIVARLPEFLGVATLIVCLYLFLAHRLPPEAALLGAATPVLSRYWLTSIEARPYGLILAAFGLAVLCWQRVDHSRWARLGLILSLALAPATHYYGVVLPLSLALAELYRLCLRRPFRWPVWIALTLSALPLLVIIPLQPGLSQYRGLFPPQQWTDPLVGYQQAALTIALAFSAIVAALLAPYLEPAAPTTQPLPKEDLALAAIIAALPAIGTVVSLAAGVAFTERYASGTIVGVSLLLGYLAAAIPRRGLAALLVPAWFLMSFGYAWTIWQSIAPIATSGTWMMQEAAQVRPFAERYPDLPIIISSNYGYVAADSYWPADLRQRALYIADPASRLKWQYEAASEIAMLRLGTLRPSMHILTLDQFLAQRRPALILRHPLDWISLELLSRGYRIETIAGKNAFDLRTIELVTPPPH